MTKITKVLIANRGEIAVRILRSVHKAGLKGVAVHHAVDAQTPAVKQADTAVEITGATPVAAYLDGAQIIAAAKESGADAIHPGYGFLSENAGFARACEEVICPLLSGPISILELVTKEEWNGEEAQAGRDHRQAA